MQRAKHEHSIGPNKHSQLVETIHSTTINTKHNEHGMLKESRSQSTQATFCTTIGIEPFFLESNTNKPFLEQLTREILNKDQRVEHT